MEKEILEDYLKDNNVLVINKSNNQIIEKEIKDLSEINENNEHMINSKLQERDDALVTLSDQVIRLMKDIQLMKNSGKH